VSDGTVAAGVPFEVWRGASDSPLVALHGFAGAPAAWGAVASAIGGRALVAAPWLPGHDPLPGWFGGGTFEDAADAIARALPALHSGPWHLLGYSLGGRLGLAMVLRHPDLFASACLVGASAGLRSEEERRARRESDAGWARLLRERGLAAFLAAWEGQPLFAGQRGLPAAMLEAQRSWREGLDAEGLARSLEWLGLGEMPDLWPALAQVRVPVLFVAGARDGKFASLAGAMAAAIPGAEARLVAGAGHNVVLEAPEALAGMLLSLIEHRGAAREVAG
jgi:2-succinyl-6-hydroxy-2,4-cyclohexadiene-1-carboxylate synthase